MVSSIGGFFELELPTYSEFHKDAIRLNTGRNAFEYILRVKRYTKVYLPYYTCDAMIEPIKKLHLKHEFYNIDKNFFPVFNFNCVQKNEVFVYNNYFGICDEQTINVSVQCKNLIIDNSQAFYSLPIPGVDTFYSPRKFFGLPDGAYLYTDSFLNFALEQDISYDRCSHLLGRLDIGALDNYQSYKDNEQSLKSQPIKKMSNLTNRLLQGIDYNSIANRRKENFNYLHKALESSNELKFVACNKEEVPLVYPYLINKGDYFKKKLLKNQFFIATYWPNVLDWSDTFSYENYLLLNLVAIPIDQRYFQKDMDRIINHIVKPINW